MCVCCGCGIALPHLTYAAYTHTYTYTHAHIHIHTHSCTPTPDILQHTVPAGVHSLQQQHQRDTQGLCGVQHATWQIVHPACVVWCVCVCVCVMFMVLCVWYCIYVCCIKHCVCVVLSTTTHHTNATCNTPDSWYPVSPIPVWKFLVGDLPMVPAPVCLCLMVYVLSAMVVCRKSCCIMWCVCVCVVVPSCVQIAIITIYSYTWFAVQHTHTFTHIMQYTHTHYTAYTHLVHLDTHKNPLLL